MGLSRSSWPEIASARDIQWLAAPSGCYYADPFWIATSAGLYLMVEQYDLGKAKAHISVLSIDAHTGQLLQTRTALKREFHLSYPFAFRHQEQLYLLPEANQSGRLTLYRWEGPADLLSRQGQWQPVADLLNIAAVDPTLWFWEDHWYLWVGLVGESARHQSALYVSGDLLGPFREHPHSPVQHPWRGRNGGRPWLDPAGVLWRPCQNRKQSYGGSLSLFRIDRLTPSQYSQHHSGEWMPHPNWPYPDGCHHIDHIGDKGWTAFDAKKTTL